MKLNLHTSNLLIVFIMLFIKQSETAGQKRLFQKINDLEIEMRQENVRRQVEIRGLQQSVDRMEDQLNNTVSILDKALTALTDTTMIGTQTLNKQRDSGKVEEILSAFKTLKRGLSEEKKVTSKFRRHVTELQSQLDEQRNISKEFSSDITSIIEAIATMDAVLHGIKNDTTKLEETGRSIISDINNTKQKCSEMEETLQTGITDSLEILKNNEKQMKDILCDTVDTLSFCGKDEIKKIRNQLMYNCENTDQTTSCLEIFAAGCKNSGEYRLNLTTGAVKVYCDQDTDGGGWVVFQRRQDGSVDFFRDWADYKNGFGSLTGEFWLGNDHIYQLLATSKQYELRIDLGDFKGNFRYAKYSRFSIGPASEGYKLEVGGYSGNAGDSLEYHNGRTFKTKDHDNNNCSGNFKGGWWYNNCHHANLNGVYNGTLQSGVIWRGWKGPMYSLRFVEMKFRERN